MRIKFLTLVTIIATSVLASQAQQKVVAEELVAIVGNQSVSLSDLFETTARVIENRKANGVESKLDPAAEALELILTQKLLCANARLDSLDKNMRPLDDDVQKKVDEMVKKAGSIKQLEQMTGKAIFQLRDDYKRDVEEMNLSQMMEREIRFKVGLTYSEVESYFDKLNVDTIGMMPPQMSYAQIVKTPPATDERKFEVRQRLLEFRERLLKGEKMAVLASLYSMDPGSKMARGEYSSTYDESVAPFSDAVRQLKVGQISEIVETEFGYHLIELISKTEENFVVRHILLKPEFTAAEETVVIQELDSIAKAIRDKKITFADAAMRHSDDMDTKMNGGVNFNIRGYHTTGDIREASPRFIIDQLDPMDGRILGRMKIGDISEPFQNYDKSANLVYKVITLLESIPAHKANMKDDYTAIERYARQMKEEKAISDWIDEKIAMMYIYINPEYTKYTFEKEGWKQQSEKCAKKQ